MPQAGLCTDACSLKYSLLLCGCPAGSRIFPSASSTPPCVVHPPLEGPPHLAHADGGMYTTGQNYDCSSSMLLAAVLIVVQMPRVSAHLLQRQLISPWSRHAQPCFRAAGVPQQPTHAAAAPQSRRGASG
jgi:hypothetical protein